MAKTPVFLAKKSSTLLLQTDARSFKIGKYDSDGPAYEIRLNNKKKLDEIFAYPEHVHLEQMDYGHWWMGISLSNGDMIHVHLTSKRKIEASFDEDRALRQAVAPQVRPARASGNKSGRKKGHDRTR
jgi:hypothetical protein